MRSLGGAVSDENVAVRTLPRPHAVEEVIHVRLRERIRTRFHSHHGWLDVAADGIELETAAIDPESARSATEFDSGPGDARRQRGFESRRIFAGILE